MVHSKQLINFLPEDLTFVSNSSNSEAVSNMVNKFSEVFKEYLFMKSPEYAGNFINPFSSKPFLSNSEIKVKTTCICELLYHSKLCLIWQKS